MLNRILIGATALAALATSAIAADFPYRHPPAYLPPTPLQAFTWTGFYVGGNIGYAFDNKTTYALSANDALAATGLAGGNVSGFSGSQSQGFTGGGQIGYNFELQSLFGGISGVGGLGAFAGGLVAGVEADVAYTDLHNSSVAAGIGGFNTIYASGTDYVGTARARVGYALDRLLIYGTGGFAYGGVRSSGVVADPITNGADYAGASDTIRTGYAYGGGLEYALPQMSVFELFNSSSVTVKAEFLHYDLGTSSVALTGANAFAGSSFTARVRNDGDLARLGMNIKFGTPAAAPAPIVARY